MWTAFIRSVIGLAGLSFLMFILVQILNPILSIATSGPSADAPSVVRVGSYFQALTLDNLTLLAALAVGIALLGAAATERRLGG